MSALVKAALAVIAAMPTVCIYSPRPSAKVGAAGVLRLLGSAAASAQRVLENLILFYESRILRGRNKTQRSPSVKTQWLGRETGHSAVLLRPLTANLVMAGCPGQGDLDEDGRTGFPDSLIMSANVGPSAGAAAVTVPGPSRLGWIGVSGLLLLARRRRR